jgi:membrane protease YdiL (CAAX protease family)
VNLPVEPPLWEKGPSSPGGSRSKATLFDTVFIGSGGVRTGWRAGVYVSLVFVLVSAGQLLTTSLGLPLRIDARDLTPAPLFLQECLLFLSALGASAALALVEGRSLGDYGLPWRRAFRAHFWQGTVWGFAEISFLILLIAGLGGYFLGPMAGGSQVFLSAGLWLAVFLMVGLAEEYAFRGYLLTTLSSGMGFWPASVLLSLGFAAVHMGNPGENPIGLATVGIVGMFFCLTVRRTGDLWFAVGAHAAHDFAQAFLYSLPNSGTLIRDPLFAVSLVGPTWLTGGAAGPEGSVLAFVALGLMIVLFAGFYPPKPDSPRLLE